MIFIQSFLCKLGAIQSSHNLLLFISGGFVAVRLQISSIFISFLIFPSELKSDFRIVSLAGLSIIRHFFQLFSFWFSDVFQVKYFSTAFHVLSFLPQFYIFLKFFF